MHSKQYIHKCGEETGRKGADRERFRNGIQVSGIPPSAVLGADRTNRFFSVFYV
jgi:hypothetical protein